MSVTQIILDALHGARVRWLTCLAVVGLAAGAGLLTAGAALAGVGAQPGDLWLTVGGSRVTSGALTSTPRWATTTACPAGHQVSANITEFTTSGTLVSLISPTVNAGLTSPFSGTLDGNVGALLYVAGVSASKPGTVEWAVGCWNGASGTGTGRTPVVYEQSTFVSVAAGATTYTTSSSPPTRHPTATALRLSAAKITYGHERSEHLSVRVAPRYRGTPAGTVTVKAGRTTVCVIRLRSGKGTCTLSARKLRAGTYHLIASYAGNSHFARSASVAKTLRVVR